MLNRSSIRLNAAKRILLAIAFASPVVGAIVAPDAAAQEQDSGAAQVTGKWAAEDDGRTITGTYNHIVLDLKVESGKLTGKYKMGGGWVQIRAATVSGSKVSFLMTITSASGDLTFKSWGEVDGDELVLNRELVQIGEGVGRPKPLVFERVDSEGQPAFATPSVAEHSAENRDEKAQAAPASANCDASPDNQTPTSRYVINGDTVYDKNSGLTWQRCSLGQHWEEGSGCIGEIKQVTWNEAMRQASGVWRVPTKDELATLISPTCNELAINEKVFPDMGLHKRWYWTSTEGDAPSVWVVGFLNGGMFGYPDRTVTSAVRLVQGGS